MPFIRKLITPQENAEIGSNIAYAVVAQGVSLLVSIAMSLVLPKMIAIEEYAHWQAFLLYTGYTGIFLLGIKDGLQLRIGGMRYDDLNFAECKSEIVAIAASQILFAAIGAILVACFAASPIVLFIGIAVCICSALSNVLETIGSLLQAANLSHLQSLGAIGNRILFFVSFLVLMAFGAQTAIPFICVQVICQAACLAYYLVCIRKILLEGSIRLRDIRVNIALDIRSGSQILIASYASSLVIGFARMAIQTTCSARDFAFAAFALSIVFFVLGFTMRVSTVLFPVLKRHDEERLRESYDLIRGSLAIILPVIYVLFPIGVALLQWWLPNYAPSFIYLGIVIPICVFDGKMSILCTTYMKVLREETALMRINIATMCASLVICLLFVFVFKGIATLLILITTCIGIRGLAAERFLVKKHIHRTHAIRAATEVGYAAFFIVSNLIFGPQSWIPVALGFVAYLVANKADISTAVRAISALRNRS